MALRIIDLDIDESLTADTRVAEVGWVLQPAIETELVYFSKNKLSEKQYARLKDFMGKVKERMEYEPGSLPDYVNYATGDTKDDMLIKPVLFVERLPGETKDEYISRCVEYHIKNEGMEADQAYAICISATEKFYKNEKVSFDYDDTLSTARGYGLALHEKFMGAQLYIISARRDKQPMLKVADKLGIPHDRVFATGSNKLKIQKIKELGISRHFDNNKDVIKELGARGIQFSCPCLDDMVAMGVELNEMIEEFNLVGFIDGEPVFSTPSEAAEYGEKIGCNGSHTYISANGEELYLPCEITPEVTSVGGEENIYFESITDYPQYITDNALRAKNWVEENGYGDCMTPVGKARLNQLANREPISLDTLKRMKAYADRHKKDLEASKSFEDGCGYLAWYSWGLDETGRVEKWLENEITNIEEMEAQFFVDEYSAEEIETAKLLKILADTDYQKFEAVVGAMRGATEQEIYKRNHKNPTIYFKYERVLSGSPDRDFCTSIEDRYFRRLEIDLLRDTNTEFGHERQPYSKWLYKGGPNCVHAWRKFLFQGKDKADQGMADGTAGIPPKSLPNNGYYSPETKRKSEVAYIVSQQNMSKQMFKSDNDQRMIYTPLMLPNILIPRNDGDGEIYFVRFRPEVIEKIRNKFMIEGRLRATNYEHSDYKFNDIVMVESWIVNGPMDKAYELGFTQEQVPIGSWMGGYKVLDTEEGDMIWNDYIKSGKVKGASVEGEFLLKFYKQDFSIEDKLLDEIISILNQVGD
jgi:hypothetical protein